MRKSVILTLIFLLTACNYSAARRAEDENIRLEISQSSFSLAETIDLEITVVGEGVYFHGPCDRWFEKVINGEWVPVGECPDTAFVDEPFPQTQGNQISVSLPTSSQDNAYAYNYSLTPGTYRYGITYWTSSGPSTCYSPQFELTND